MNTLYLECAMGAAGDMLMGALYELLDDKASFLETMNHLIPGVEVRAERGVTAGICGTHMRVLVHGEAASILTSTIRDTFMSMRTNMNISTNTCTARKIPLGINLCRCTSMCMVRSRGSLAGLLWNTSMCMTMHMAMRIITTPRRGRLPL